MVAPPDHLGRHVLYCAAEGVGPVLCLVGEKLPAKIHHQYFVIFLWMKNFFYLCNVWYSVKLIIFAVFYRNWRRFQISAKHLFFYIKFRSRVTMRLYMFCANLNCADFCSLLWYLPWEPKVCEGNMTVTIQEDVFQFDVPVDDAILRKKLMKIFVSIENIFFQRYKTS